MRADGAAFYAANTAATRKPRFVIELAFDNAATDLLYLTSHADCEVPEAAITGGYVIYNVVRSLAGQSQSIDPLSAVSTIGGFSFDVVDLDEAVTIYLRDKQAAGYGLRHKRVRAYVGFEGIAWDDYQVILTYIIDGIDSQDDLYSISCSDIQRAERNRIFIPDVTYLTASITSAQMYIPVLETDTSKFKAVAHDASYTDRPSTIVGYVQIEDELIAHSGLSFDTTYGYILTVVSDGRGALNTKAVEHVFDSGASSNRTLKVTEHIFLEGPAPKIIYALQTGLLHGQYDGSSPPVQYTLPDNWHLGISTSFVKLSDFTGIGPDLWDSGTAGRMVRIDGPKETDGKQFIERELLLWLGCFMPVYSSGELGLKRLSPVLSNSSYAITLDETNVVKYGKLRHDLKNIINQLQVDWNHVFTKDDFTKRSLMIDSDSIGIHNQAPLKKYELFPVHTGTHTDEDLINYFNSMRDRYSGPPLLIDVDVLPSLNRLEVGDVVRLDLDQIRDFNVPGATKLDRVFEVQRMQMNWMTGNFKLSLFGSSQKAGTLARTALSAVLDDTFYNSAGTDLSTVLTISGGAVTANGSTPGGSTPATSSMENGIYYYLGDLTINAGVTVTISSNVQWRIRGSLTINGTIDGAGNGISGGIGATAIVTAPWDSNETDGTAGYLGNTQAQSGIHSADDVLVKALISQPPLTVTGANASIPYASLTNNSTSIDGLFTDLRGSSGGGGGPVVQYKLNGSYVYRAAGGDGGAGGAGFMIISRGLSFGASGSIDTSGDPGAAGGSWTDGQGHTLYGGVGGAGAPGGLAIFLDGNHTPPELTTEHVATYGESTIFGSPVTSLVHQLPAGPYSSGHRGIHSYDMGSSAYSIQFIPQYEVPELEDLLTLPGVDDFASYNYYYHAAFESLDGFNFVRVTLNATSGYALLATSTLGAQLVKQILNPITTLDSTKNWAARASFSIGIGTGANLSAQYLTVSSSASNREYGLRVKWNSGTSMLDIYAYYWDGSTTYETLITSIADTGIIVDAGFVYAPSSYHTVTVTISGTVYSAQIATAAGSTTPVTAIMYYHIGAGTSANVDAYVYDHKVLQYE